MNCPNCGVIFQMWENNCLQCGINFLQFYEERANKPKPAPSFKAVGEPPAPKRQRKRKAASRVLLPGALFFGILAALAAVARAPLPPGAFHDDEAELVFVPPEGWLMKTDLGTGWRFRSVARLTGPGGRIDVEVAPTVIPVEAHLGELILEEFNGRSPELGEKSGLRVAGTDGKRLPFRASDGPNTPAIIGEAVFLPGAGRNYLFRFYSTADGIVRGQRDWAAFLGTVRVRRAPFASLLNWITG